MVSPLVSDLTRLFCPKIKHTELTVLRTPEGASLEPHLDNIRAMKGQALYMIQPAELGGILHCHIDSDILAFPTLAGECVYFDPNRIVHSVSRVEKGERFVLSVALF